MPRKQIQEMNQERPYYINADGTLDPTKIFKLQFKQTELLRTVIRDGFPYVMPVAPQCLSVGGFRSGKTVGWLMFLVMHYCLAWKKCDILVLRRTFPELENGAIRDFRTFVPQELYKYDQTKHIATFFNGSRVVFGHCEHNKMRDIEQYLGQAYVAILIDECGQFSPEAWQMLYTRNIVNPACERDEHLDADGLGHLPVPIMIGCTNPIGPFYEYYRTIFVQKEPYQKPENARLDTDGTWWIEEAGVNKLLYVPWDYAYQRSTVLDNPALMKRDPAFFHKLNRLPKAERDKKLLGLDGVVEGQYFDCFDSTYHVINTREDPDAIIWQNYQPVWAGQDWGMGHANAVYLFTKALVRHMEGSDYKLKTVCFGELVTTGGKTYKELASLVASRCKLPNGTKIVLKSIYFSHEKFARQVDIHTPADDYSRALKALGLPGVTPATRDRIGRASFMYNAFKNGELVILDVCKDIILAIPNLMRNPNEMDDVLKVDCRGDDCYDGFSYGLFGQLKEKKRPAVEAILDHAKKLEAQGPEGMLAAFFYKQKMLRDRTHENAPFLPPEMPLWMSKINTDL